MKIKRYFTKEDVSVYDMFKWKKVNVNIKNSEGYDIFNSDDLLFPEHYSQTACNIIAKMYFRKTGVPGIGHETSLMQVVERMVNFWVLHAIKDNIIEPILDNEKILKDELMYMLLNQMWAPNSPQWFNTGLYLAYGIETNGANMYYWDEVENCVKEAINAYAGTQASACFILNVKDTLIGHQSLTEHNVTATKLFKFGSGVGSNWSNIRAANEKLNDGGRSSGVLSFLKLFDANAGTIKSGGVTRRAAVMNVLNDDHPDIIDFINWKKLEERKAYALVKMGYSSDIYGEAYATVSGQNVNNSVSISDSFMNAYENNKLWKLVGRVDKELNKEVPAKEIWNSISEAAWECGDPGIQFTDTINKWNTCKNSGRIDGSNPCSEYLFLNDTSCNLASINVLKFYDIENDTFDLSGYLHAIELIQIVLEASIHGGYFPTPEIAKNTYKFRTTGLGLTNISSLLMALGIPYASEEGRLLVSVLCNIMTAKSYLTSADMAKSIGSPFSEFEKNRQCMLDVIKLHQDTNEYNMNKANDENILFKNLFINSENEVVDIWNFADYLWDATYNRGELYGFRNAQVTVLAPTGTISFAMDCESQSIEPFFSNIVYKKLIDGNVIKIVNNMIPHALKKLNYSEEDIKIILDYIIESDGDLDEAPMLKEEHFNVFKCASATYALELTADEHLSMVGAVTPNLSGGISKTINISHETTIGEISDIFYNAWKLGCKCITVYRDGCKVSQPLHTMISKSNNEKTYKELTDFMDNIQNAIMNDDINKVFEIASNGHKQFNPSKYVTGKRERLCNNPLSNKYSVRLDGKTYHINRAFYDDGRLGEIFVSVGKQGSTIKGLMEVLCILISKSLQYGIPSEVISNILRSHEFEPKGLVSGHPNIKQVSSIVDLISKFIDISNDDYRFCQVKPDDLLGCELKTETVNTVMEKVIEEKVYGEICNSCGSSSIIKAGTCKYCSNCGTSSGCS